ncbi:GNAT family N-acetyltransferase [Caulobacter sp. 1776]|uniref:GNAT family N-acetyltransferase n=1 Tax=Caulobacter sp. 1776 TaxID=3156420 RepID=UPI0033934A94
MGIRTAQTRDIGPLARLWWQGWRDAHLPIVPKALVARRTLDSFIVRMALALPHIRTVGPVGEPLGFHLLKGDELHQLYVEEEMRGAGVAALLMADAEDRLLEAGIMTPWLACAVGNVRAARFYKKAGWALAGTQTMPTEIPGGWFPLKVWRYEKRLSAAPSAWGAAAEAELFRPSERTAEAPRADIGAAPRTIM